jgi:arylsulfatase A-like enzyme
MIARWPAQVEPGTESSHISAFWDVMPTLAEMAGVYLSDTLDGRSFLPTLTGEGTQVKHEYLYWEFHEKGGRIAVRKGKWKGIKYNVQEEPGKGIELYDLTLDPGETQNVASEFPAVVEELTGIMKSARTESDVFQFNASTFLNVE